MREARKTQSTLRETWLDLDHAKELEAMSRVLDDNPTIAQLVWQDLRGADSGSKSSARGAGGLSAEQVLRILVVKQMNGFSYRQLAFHLADSRSYRTFCLLGITDKVPTKSALNANLKALQPATLEAINRAFIGAAQKAKVETGRIVRTDCTVVESNIHEPMDSELLWDCVRVLLRLLERTRDLLGPAKVAFGSRTRRAKRRRKEIFNAKKAEDRQRAYQDLLAVTAELYGHGLRIHKLLQDTEVLNNLGFWEALAAQGVASELDRFLALTQRVMDQTQRRVLNGESVPAAEKLVSIFEEHTDIIRKDNRETLYGHKICLTGGASSMILDCQVLEGNPADSTLAKEMVEAALASVLPGSAVSRGRTTCRPRSSSALTLLRAPPAQDPHHPGPLLPASPPPDGRRGRTAKTPHHPNAARASGEPPDRSPLPGAAGLPPGRSPTGVPARISRRYRNISPGGARCPG
jgi:transposase, IS5 family